MLSQFDQTHGFLQAKPFDPFANFLFPNEGFGGFWIDLLRGVRKGG